MNSHYQLLTFRNLRKALQEAGLPQSRNTLRKYEREGKISLPRLPNGWVAFKNQEEIDEIVRLLSPRYQN